MCIGWDFLSIFQTWLSRKGETKSCYRFVTTYKLAPLGNATVSVGGTREFKRLRRLRQRKCHIKIIVCVGLSVLQLLRVLVMLFKIGPVFFHLIGTNSFHAKEKNGRFTAAGSRLSSEPQKWKFHVLVWQTTSNDGTKKRATRAARLFFLIQAIKSLICGAVVAVAVVIPYCNEERMESPLTSLLLYEFHSMRRIPMQKCTSKV